MVNKLLFVYTTRSAGYSMDMIAKELRLTRASLSKKLNGKSEFRSNEIEAWGTAVGVQYITPVFFPSLVSSAEHARGVKNEPEIDG